MNHYSLWLLLLVGSVLPGRGQALDSTFQPPTLLNQNQNTAAGVLALTAQADGKALVAGDFQAAGAC